MKLPFLAESKWPTMREPEERVVNPSSDQKLQDHLVGELLVSYEKKDQKRLYECLKSLIYSIESEEHETTS